MPNIPKRKDAGVAQGSRPSGQRNKKNAAHGNTRFNGDSTPELTEAQVAAHNRQQRLDWLRETGQTPGEVDDEYMRHLEQVSLDTNQVKALRPPPMLIGQHLFRNTTARIYGPPGSGKTFLILDWALSMASVKEGDWWHQVPIVGGPVVYVVAEGASGLGRRITAWEKHRGMDKYVHRIRWQQEAVNLFDDAAAAGFARWVERMRRAPALIVFDTLARCTVGADENSAKDASVVIANMEMIKRASGACVLVIHHTGYDTSHGRGTTAYLGALDTELAIKDEGGGRLKLDNPKQKDAAEARRMHLSRITSGGSCVIVDGSGSDAADGGDGRAGDLALLEVLREAQGTNGLTSGEWKAAAGGKRAFYNQKARLETDEKVVKNGSRFMVAEDV